MRIVIGGLRAASAPPQMALVKEKLMIFYALMQRKRCYFIKAAGMVICGYVDIRALAKCHLVAYNDLTSGAIRRRDVVACLIASKWW